MTGGGFAGCAVAPAERDTAGDFVDHVLSDFAPPAEQPVEAPVRLPCGRGGCRRVNPSFPTAGWRHPYP